jgi:23S rRNA (pseudouridine1915-N3)-methyltransferase
MRIKVVWFGRPARSPFEEQVALYVKRVSRRWPSEDIALRPAAGGREQDAARALHNEAGAVLGAVPDKWQLVILDERGKAFDSKGLSRWLEESEASATPGLVFAVGSDLGIAAELRQRAALCLSLSPLTLPHLLARVLLWEQLFRATDILGSGRYHRRGVQ